MSCDLIIYHVITLELFTFMKYRTFNGIKSFGEIILSVGFILNTDIILYISLIPNVSLRMIAFRNELNI